MILSPLPLLGDSTCPAGNYNQGGAPNPKLDPLIRPLGLSDREKSDVAAFLRSLTGAQRYAAPKPLPDRAPASGGER